MYLECILILNVLWMLLLIFLQKCQYISCKKWLWENVFSVYFECILALILNTFWQCIQNTTIIHWKKWIQIINTKYSTDLLKNTALLLQTYINTEQSLEGQSRLCNQIVKKILVDTLWIIFQLHFLIFSYVFKEKCRFLPKMYPQCHNNICSCIQTRFNIKAKIYSKYIENTFWIHFKEKMSLFCKKCIHNFIKVSTAVSKLGLKSEPK